MPNDITQPAATAAPAAPVFPPMKVPGAPIAPAVQPPAAPVIKQPNGAAPTTTLAQIIAYSKANPNTQYAQQAYKLIKSGAFDAQAQKEGVDLSWAGRPKAAAASSKGQGQDIGQDKGQTETPKATLGDLDMEQLKGSAQKIIDSVQNAGTKEQHDANGTVFGEAKGVGDVLEGLLGAGSGIVQGVAAPVSSVLQYALQYDPAAAKDDQPDEAKAQAQGIPVADYQKQAAAGKEIATAHPELIQNLKDAVNVGAALYGGAEGLIPGGNMTLGDFAQTGKGMLEDAATTVKNGAAKLNDAVGATKVPGDTVPPDEPPGGGAGTIGKVRNSAIASAIGVQPATVKDILERPDLYTTENMANASRQNIAEEVAAGINKKVGELEHMKTSAAVHPRQLADQVRTGLAFKEHDLSIAARKYGDVTGARIPGSTEGPNITVAKNWLDRQIEKVTGRTVTKGRIDPKPNSAAAVRQPKDINTLQRFLDTHRPAFQTGKLSGNEFLNIRDDLDTNLANFDHSGTPSTDLEKVGKSLYANLNDSYRGKFPGLLKVDTDYAEAKEDLDRLKVGLIDNNGELSENAMNRIRNSAGDKFAVGDKLEQLVPDIKARVAKLGEIESEQNRYRAGIVDKTGHLLDGAANRIANAGGVGKDLLSGRLEEVAPGIGDKLKFLKGVEDIKGATGIKTGSYIKAGLTLMSGPFGLATFAITHPDVAVPLLRKFGMSEAQAAKTAADLGVDEFAADRAADK